MELNAQSKALLIELLNATAVVIKGYENKNLENEQNIMKYKKLLTDIYYIQDIVRKNITLYDYISTTDNCDFRKILNTLDEILLQ